ncbi:MAG TPA: universal stress protein [Methanolinea sp.]|nr:universal stress protein [Methanolinea sp.]
MYEKVLVPFDFSADSRHAIAHLTQIPGLSRVVLLHVIYTKYPKSDTVTMDPSADYARLRLEEYARSIDWQGISVRTRIEAISGGDISAVVNRVATEESASLVVMGKRGMGIIETLLIGSVASEVLRYGDRDLLLVHAPRSQKSDTQEPLEVPPLFSHLLVCTDFSAPDIVALCKEELPFASRVTLLHVVSTYDSGEGGHLNSSDAWTRLKALRDEYSSLRIPVRATVCEGDPAEEIIRHARENDVSLIVMKSAGKRGFIKNFLGSTTMNVTRNADIPVLVLKRIEPMTR